MENVGNMALIPILIASIIGSPHCAGMCGGFVGIYSHNAPGRFMPHFLYSIGRLVTYLSLGLIAAVAGHSFDSVTEVANLSALVVGIALVIGGVIKLCLGTISTRSPISEKISKGLQLIAKPIFKSESAFKPFFIGLVTTLLPCGWLYTFVALALASSDITKGLIVMCVFWLGTLPVMLSLGVASRWLTTMLGRHLPRVVGILLILGGLLSINLHFNHAGHNHHVTSESEHSHHHHE